jgi:hypothetical protein
MVFPGYGNIPVFIHCYLRFSAGDAKTVTSGDIEMLANHDRFTQANLFKLGKPDPGVHGAADRNGVAGAYGQLLGYTDGFSLVEGDELGLVVAHLLGAIMLDEHIHVFLCLNKDLLRAFFVLKAELVKPATTFGTVALDGALSDLEKIFLFFYKNIFS